LKIQKCCDYKQLIPSQYSDIACALWKFVDEGVSSIQIHLNRTTPETIERLAPVLEAFDAD
jgi:hypothetical protein